MLKGNNDNVTSMRWLSGSFATLIDTTGDQNKIYNNGLAFGMKVGKPYGYNGLNGILLPQQTGGFIRALMSGSGDFAGIISGVANLNVTMSGVGTITPNINAAYNMFLTMSGAGTMTPGLKAIANMIATLSAGASPSAFDISQETWNSIIEEGLTAGDVLKIIAAVLAGKTTITKGLGDNAIVIFRDVNNRKDVITATMEGSERKNIALNK